MWELSEQVVVGDGEEEDQEESKAEANEVFEEYIQNSVLSGHGGWVWDCDFTQDCNYIITVSTDQKVRIWKTGKDEICKKILAGHTKGITCLAFRDSS